MKQEIATICTRQITVKEFKGLRVVTFKDIDLVHERPEGTAGRNFRENKSKLIRNEDYFNVTGQELNQFKQATNFVGSNAKEIILLTEQGYLMLVKSFTDDLAWKVQRELVGVYFKDNQSLKQFTVAFEQKFNELEDKLRLKIEELAEQADENHRPSHRTKLSWNNIIKEYAVCKGDEELLKQATLEQFNAAKWEDIPYNKKSEVLQYIRTLAKDLKMFVQESLFNS